jgi:hypothetical protein
MLGYTRPVTQGATHYHTHAVNPIWNSGLVETTSIDSHVFYRFPNRSERAYYQEALARRRGALGSRHRAPVEELIPEADAAALETIEEAVTEAPAQDEAVPTAAPAPVPALDAPEAPTDTSAANTVMAPAEVAT